jgi:hypothetical protein
MTAYNVISPASLVAGQPEDISVILANLQAIQGVLNGGIDNSNLNGAAAIAASKLAGYPADALKYLRGDGSWAVQPTLITGDELGYAALTAPVTITSTAEATPTDVITAPTQTFDGSTPALIEFFSVLAQTTAGSNLTLIFQLWDGATCLGRLGYIFAGSSQTGLPIRLMHRFIPSAGAHTFKITAFANASGATVYGGPGGAAPGTYMPGYVRILRVSPVPPSVAAGAFTATYYGTTFPISPADGQEAILVDSVTAPTYHWRFRYNAGSSSPYKWECIGGAPANAYVAAGEATSSTAYVALTTPGPIISLPLAGVYDVRIGCDVSAVDQAGSLMSYDIGATAANDAWGVGAPPRGAGGAHSMFGTRRQTLASPATLTAKYRTASATPAFSKRVMEIVPVRLG